MASGVKALFILKFPAGAAVQPDHFDIFILIIHRPSHSSGHRYWFHERRLLRDRYIHQCLFDMNVVCTFLEVNSAGSLHANQGSHSQDDPEDVEPGDPSGVHSVAITLAILSSCL